MERYEQVKPSQLTATISYIARRDEPLYNYYLTEPPSGIPASNEELEPHDVVITNLRDLAEPPRLDVQGFELVRFTSASDVYDPEERKAVYEAEVETFIKQHTGAAEARVYYPMLRGEEAQRRFPGSITQPAANAHVDETHETGADVFAMILGPDADRYRGRRFAVINLWRPITGPLQDHPLAICDARTIAFDDLMSSRAISRVDDNGLPTSGGTTYETAIYSVAYSPAHRWYYVRDMMPNEALLLKNYDSELEGVARFSPHTSFEDPGMPAGALPRASIEVRCLTIW